MLPLVQDLIDNYVAEEVQAIFLYPLNALMEDQKARMEKLLAGTDLKFAVYNGDMPQFIPSPEDANYKKILRKVDAIKGITRDEQGNVIEEKYPHVIATREELRQHPANILHPCSQIFPHGATNRFLCRQTEHLFHLSQPSSERTHRQQHQPLSEQPHL